jgi:hypothetical protein
MNQQSPTLLSCWRTVSHSLAGTACRFMLSQCSTQHHLMRLSPGMSCCILGLQSVYHVCWMRGLFPEGSFTGHDLAQLDSESPSRHAVILHRPAGSFAGHFASPAPCACHLALSCMGVPYTGCTSSKAHAESFVLHAHAAVQPAMPVTR